MEVRETLRRFDRFLADRRLRLEAVVVGGAALGLLGVIDRPTRDCDILHPELSPSVVAAAREFARACRDVGAPVDDDWLNNGPASLAKQLPAGWLARLQDAFRGEAIVLRSLGRSDLLLSKLFALCDRGTDIGDCIALAPTADELKVAVAWLREQDANPQWPEHVERTVADLSARLGHGIHEAK